jgi:membrane protein DedA with SNARE-associated domain
LGARWFARYGAVIHITPRRVKLGQYLFRTHGDAVVFFGRFMAVLRALYAFLAGTNRMQWPRFLLRNAAGGVVWAYGFAGYTFGEQMMRVAGPIAIALGATAIVLGIAAIVSVGVMSGNCQIEQSARWCLERMETKL